jgi:DNA-binding NarL/FixJ family response regulator
MTAVSIGGRRPPRGGPATPASSVVATSLAFSVFREVEVDEAERRVQRAVDYLLKSFDGDQFGAGDRAAAGGGRATRSVVDLRRHQRDVLGLPSQPDRRDPHPFPALSARERDILEPRLALSEKTVRNNVSAILAKLRVGDRSSAIVQGRQAGLGTDTSPP